MKLRSIFLLLVFILSACTSPSSTATVVSPGVVPSATAPGKLPTAQVRMTQAPDVRGAVTAFLDAWKAEDYAAMYAMLSPLSQDAFTPEQFAERYNDTAMNMTLQSLEYEILSNLTNPTTAKAAYRVTFHTKMVGDLTRTIEDMNLILDNGSWKIQWEEGLIMPELRGGNRLQISFDPSGRGNIYDRNERGLALHSDVVALGIDTSKLDEDHESLLLSELAALTGRTADSIRALYEDAFPGEYIAVGEATKDAVEARYNVLSGLGELVMSDYSGRFYPQGGIGPHVVGYVQGMYKEEVEEFTRLGYQMNDRIGRSGIEAWGENYLTGQRGVSLDVYNAQGQQIARLSKVDSTPPLSIYTTIDSNLQLQAQRAMSGFKGGLVVMERDTGRVLAIVSTPEFDPNAFEFSNANASAYKLPSDALYNRATMDGYPLGSVFKIITLAAALESNIYPSDITLDCQHKWVSPENGREYEDWTFDKGLNPSGVLTLPEALIRSCNPWFYQMGYDLFVGNHTKAVSDMARAFGLGSRTGIEGVAEAPGNIPDPQSSDEAVVLAIGQGNILVNPLQVARFVAAVGNGGTLYRPQLVESMVDPEGNATFTFTPDPKGTLPVSPENLEIIQEAMRAVVDSPRGTAVSTFGGLSTPIHGKTGTAQNDWAGHPHAWFAGYTNTGRTDKPDIAIAVIAEYAGEGSEIAAKIFRRVIEVYYLGQPQTVYPWESRLNVTRTPTLADGEMPEADDREETPRPGDSGGSAADPDDGFNLRTATPSQ